MHHMKQNILLPATLSMYDFPMKKHNLRESYPVNEKICELQKEIELLRAEIRYLKYVWDLKEITGQEKEVSTTVYVNTRKKIMDNED